MCAKSEPHESGVEVVTLSNVCAIEVLSFTSKLTLRNAFFWGLMIAAAWCGLYFVSVYFEFRGTKYAMKRTTMLVACGASLFVFATASVVDWIGRSRSPMERFIACRPNCQGVNLAKIKLSSVNLSKINLEGANLKGAKLDDVDLSGADLSDSNLDESWLTRVDLSGADLSYAHVNDAILDAVVAHKSSFASATLEHTWILGSKITKSNLMMVNASALRIDTSTISDSNFAGANLEFCRVEKSQLVRVNMQKSHVTWCHFDDSELRDSNMSNTYAKELVSNNSRYRGTSLRRTIFTNGADGDCFPGAPHYANEQYFDGKCNPEQFYLASDSRPPSEDPSNSGGYGDDDGSYDSNPGPCDGYNGCVITGDGEYGYDYQNDPYDRLGDGR